MKRERVMRYAYSLWQPNDGKFDAMLLPLGGEISATTFDKSIKIALSEPTKKREKSAQEVIVQLLLASAARKKSQFYSFTKKV
jgi:hypothetical protein